MKYWKKLAAIGTAITGFLGFSVLETLANDDIITIGNRGKFQTEEKSNFIGYPKLPSDPIKFDQDKNIVTIPEQPSRPVRFKKPSKEVIGYPELPNDPVKLDQSQKSPFDVKIDYIRFLVNGENVNIATQENYVIPSGAKVDIEVRAIKNFDDERLNGLENLLGNSRLKGKVFVDYGNNKTREEIVLRRENEDGALTSSDITGNGEIIFKGTHTIPNYNDLRDNREDLTNENKVKYTTSLVGSNRWASGREELASDSQEFEVDNGIGITSIDCFPRGDDIHCDYTVRCKGEYCEENGLDFYLIPSLVHHGETERQQIPDWGLEDQKHRINPGEDYTTVGIDISKDNFNFNSDGRNTTASATVYGDMKTSIGINPSKSKRFNNLRK